MNDTEAELFAPHELPVTVKPVRKEKCGQCEHIQRWHNDFVSETHQVTFYCDVRKSGRTSNGLLKVKCKTPACDYFEEGK